MTEHPMRVLNDIKRALTTTKRLESRARKLRHKETRMLAVTALSYLRSARLHQKSAVNHWPNDPRHHKAATEARTDFHMGQLYLNDAKSTLKRSR
ncbi:hypothetical protein EV191_1402 [Tamaricihabitans halophyticus]|uniref:Uncharacterized protein n=1 Tax=Tamaricihabitans halophyticus TaxID=1262583 RepID=A0A4R2PUA7_9PSEU|nr:hypothetical protein [Tamaricihabitans halophyticus]TCP38754.1 hypothetical protein EV191_1402 [Tamaricihabitans halophyticus]